MRVHIGMQTSLLGTTCKPRIAEPFEASVPPIIYFRSSRLQLQRPIIILIFDFDS